MDKSFDTVMYHVEDAQSRVTMLEDQLDTLRREHDDMKMQFGALSSTVSVMQDEPLMSAATFFENPPEEQVTYYDLKAKPMDPVTWQLFAQIDHLLVPRDWLSCVRDVYSARGCGMS